MAKYITDQGLMEVLLKIKYHLELSQKKRLQLLINELMTLTFVPFKPFLSKNTMLHSFYSVLCFFLLLSSVCFFNSENIMFGHHVCVYVD